MDSRLEQLLTELRAGRVLSAANERKLRAAAEALQEILDQLAQEDDGRAGEATLEQRAVPVDAVEIRQLDDGEQVIAGHAAVFNRLSVPLWGFRERIQPGAFAQSLESEADVRALWQHDMSRVLGRTKNGTLRLWEDGEGLAFELDPPDTQDGRDAMTLIGRGDIDQMSFGFMVMPEGDRWTDDEHEGIIRDLVTVDLKEISPVTWAAYPQTDVSVAMRSAPEWVRRALDPNGDEHREDDDQWRALLDIQRKRIDLVETEL